MSPRIFVLTTLLITCVFTKAYSQFGNMEKTEALLDSLHVATKTMTELTAKIADLTESNIESNARTQSLTRIVTWLTGIITLLTLIQATSALGLIETLRRKLSEKKRSAQQARSAHDNKRKRTRSPKEIPKKRQTTPDRTLTCVECGSEFNFSEDEQQFYSARGFRDPKRCRNCREKRKETEKQSRV